MFRSCMKMAGSQLDLLENQINVRDEIWKNTIEPFVFSFVIGIYIAVQAFAAYFYFESFITLVILFITGALLQHICANQISNACERTRLAFKRIRILVAILDYLLVVSTLAAAYKWGHYWAMGIAFCQCSFMIAYGFTLVKSVRQELAD